MEAIYSTAQIRINGSDFPLYPGLSSLNYSRLIKSNQY